MSKELDKASKIMIDIFMVDFKYQYARVRAKLLVKVINKLSFELGHPKDDLVFIIKEMIKKGEL